MDIATPKMRLTAELAALCHRDVADPGPAPGFDHFEDDDYVRATAKVMAEKPVGPLWVFAYGSLIWKPEFPTIERRRAVADGWHRAFSIKIEKYRATPQQPGYMMCLDRGGQCEGVALRLADDDLAGQVYKLLYRELSSNEGMESMRWIDLQTDQGPVRALCFYAHPHLLDIYSEGRPLEQVAHALARACGHWGSGAEYLYNTVAHLTEIGIDDANLWKLQELVAHEIELIYGR
jgi:cation transport protein ChaC